MQASQHPSERSLETQGMQKRNILISHYLITFTSKNMGISGPTKRTHVLQINFKKVMSFLCFLHVNTLLLGAMCYSVIILADFTRLSDLSSSNNLLGCQLDLINSSILSCLKVHPLRSFAFIGSNIQEGHISLRFTLLFEDRTQMKDTSPTD